MLYINRYIYIYMLYIYIDLHLKHMSGDHILDNGFSRPSMFKTRIVVFSHKGIPSTVWTTIPVLEVQQVYIN